MPNIHGGEVNGVENTDDLVLNITHDDLGITNACINEIQQSHRLGPKNCNETLAQYNVSQTNNNQVYKLLYITHTHTHTHTV